MSDVISDRERWHFSVAAQLLRRHSGHIGKVFLEKGSMKDMFVGGMESEIRQVFDDIDAERVARQLQFVIRAAIAHTRKDNGELMEAFYAEKVGLHKRPSAFLGNLFSELHVRRRELRDTIVFINALHDYSDYLKKAVHKIPVGSPEEAECILRLEERDRVRPQSPVAIGDHTRHTHEHLVERQNAREAFMTPEQSNRMDPLGAIDRLDAMLSLEAMPNEERRELRDIRYRRVELAEKEFEREKILSEMDDHLIDYVLEDLEGKDAKLITSFFRQHPEIRPRLIDDLSLGKRYVKMAHPEIVRGFQKDAAAKAENAEPEKQAYSYYPDAY